ncbi:DUF1389 domain-containing protein [Chlamydia vaughanii]|uniref:DUF1389 domain-containing protein n=1 Tax=Chlamydia vaughanii TaxID=3112552 RepID=UPI0032B1C430
MICSKTSNNTTNFVVEKQQLHNHVVLHRSALAIAGTVLTIISVVIAIIIACGVVHPAIVIVAITGILIAGVLGYFAIFSIPLKGKSPIPEALLEVIQKEYGEVVHKLILRKGITIQELRSIINWINSGCTEEISGSAQQKVKSFGIKKLKKEQKEREPLLPLEDLLLKHCPAYFLKRFIEQGDRWIPIENEMPPEEYWTAPLGMAEEGPTVFNCQTWLFAQVILKEEYKLFGECWEQGVWYAGAGVKGYGDCIRSRMIKLLNKIEEDHPKDLLIENGDPARKIREDDWLRGLFEHGVRWEQIQLFKKVGIFTLSLMEARDLSEFKLDVYPCLNEDDESSYNHEKVFKTIREYVRDQ